MKKDKTFISFEELPLRTQHALEVLMEWHSVLVYEIKKGMYGFYVLDEYMPFGPDFTGLVENEYVCSGHFIQKTILNIIKTRFKGIRCRYFPKGYMPEGKLRVEIYQACLLSYGFGFSIEVHTNDYGFLDEERGKIAPAYAHVLDDNELEIGLLNITGPCPKKISDIKEFRPPHGFGDDEPMKITPLMKHRKNIVKWANNIRVVTNKSNWNWIQEVAWESSRRDSR
jgi:hypothetical protein